LNWRWCKPFGSASADQSFREQAILDKDGLGEEFRMAGSFQKPRLSAEQRSALMILAASPRGLTEALLLAYGFKRDVSAGLVLAGLAIVVTETVRTGGPTIKVERVRITSAGRWALGETGESSPLGQGTD
jgi:hypothetical protein